MSLVPGLFIGEGAVETLVSSLCFLPGIEGYPDED